MKKQKTESNLENDRFIDIRGAKVHNLKNVSLKIPRNTITVFTGLSGSGKSSLAFDTVFAEGQRRYVESLSTYARQFLEVLEKPEVESIDGLSPTISIQQKSTSHNPRSTVGTVTEIYDFLRLLFSRVSISYCHECGKPIRSQTVQQIVDQILELKEGSKISILSPLVRGRKGEYQKELQQFRQKGFSRVRIDGETLDLVQDIFLDKQKKHDIDIYIDRLIIRKNPAPGIKSTVPDPIITLRARIHDSVETALKHSEGLVRLSIEGEAEEPLYSEKFACIDCGVSYPEPEPRTFSFNSPMGACVQCDGLGYFKESLAEADNDNDDEILAEALTIYVPCTSCNGSRLKKESLYFKINGKNISDYSSQTISKLYQTISELKLDSRSMLIADRILKEIKDRLSFLLNVGVDYLSLDRSAQTLSGGESQRIRLASQIGSSLTGVTYILDEPSIGLHQRDNDRLLETLVRLKDNGNTVLVVEHDFDTMKKANHIVDLGPGAGILGGSIVAEGSVSDIISSPNSLTGKYLAGTAKIPVPKTRRNYLNADFISLNGVTHNNLNNLDVKIPLSKFICVTGVSGSGKSTLILDTLYPLTMHHLHGSKAPKVSFKAISGIDKIDKVIDIDQSPIGRTPRSNPATYTGLYTIVRDLFSSIPEAKVRGFKPGRFSFNVKGGRCEKCQGAGMAKIEMHFLSDIYVRCDECDGRRFNFETLSIKYKGCSISQVLDLTIDEAAELFKNVPNLFQKLSTLKDVGLGYITLGQSATTLSGGEAQRMKLARELSKRATGKTLYILDEPSTGLHFDDIRKLIELLHRLVDNGNTVIVIEHNLDIIKNADYILDLGPEGGIGGGKIIAQGTPEEVAKQKSSHTGRYLKSYL